MGGVKYLECDGADAETCAQAGIQSTPVTIIAGQALVGKLDKEVVRAAANVPAMIAAHLAASGAVLFGRDSCRYTEWQKTVFGKHFAAIPYIRCDADKESAAKCSDAGLQGVPAWRVGGAIHEGYHRLDQLAELSGMVGVDMHPQGPQGTR